MRAQHQPEMMFIVEEGDPRGDTKEMLEMACSEFEKNPNIMGGFITLTNGIGELINLSAGLTLSDEVLLRQFASQDRFDEWRDNGDDFDVE